MKRAELLEPKRAPADVLSSSPAMTHRRAHHAAADLAALDHAHVWHPFTPMRQWREQPPLIIERGEGEFLFDVDGKRYIDGVSSLWCNVHGHRVPEIDQAIRDQLERVAHTTLLGLASPPSIELATRLVAWVNTSVNPPSAIPHPPSSPPHPPLTKVFYSDAGATAVEVAFKMAVGYWHHRSRPGKSHFIGMSGAYHGDTTGAMSVGYSDVFHRPYLSMVFPTRWFPPPLPGGEGYVWPSENAAAVERSQAHSLRELESLLQQHADETAAIVIEPVMQGAAGMICQPAGFLRQVAALARKHEVLLIADEVATGFGRTGRMFACEHDGVTPDILCLGKGITGGYLPLAATLATDEIEQAFCGEFAEQRTLYHGHTYTGNALACAAALASLDLFERTKLLDHINASAAIIADGLAALRDSARYPHVLDVRQRGLMVGIELGEDRTTRKPFDPARRTGAAVCLAMRKQGVILRPLGDVVVLMPIPAMPHASLHRLLDVLLDALASTVGKHGAGPGNGLAPEA